MTTDHPGALNRPSRQFQAGHCHTDRHRHRAQHRLINRTTAGDNYDHLPVAETYSYTPLAQGPLLGLQQADGSDVLLYRRLNARC